MKARIAQRYPTAAADKRAVTDCAPSGRLDVASTTPASTSSPRSPSQRLLNSLATDTVEQCGLEESGIVIDLRDGQVLVETISRSSCSQCSSGNCSTSVVAKLFGLRRNLLAVGNTIDAKPGDRVTVGIPDALLVRASLWAYLLPLLTMFTATLIALRFGAGDGAQALAAACGLLGGYLSMRLLIQHSRRRRDFQPQLLRIEGRRQVEPEFEGIPLGSSH